MSKHLQTTFDHEQITVRRGWGTNEGGNYISVLFYNFEVDTKSNDGLRLLAVNVREELLTKYVELERMDLIEVKFTADVDGEEAAKSISFKFNKDSR